MNAPKPSQRGPGNREQGTTEPGTVGANIIRTETVFSRLPIHQLSKRGRIEIRIIQRERSGGQISLYWRVSPNPEFGEPRQLAYKLDTLIVNQRLNDLARPLPRIIRLGSLHAIAERLGLARTTDRVKQIFRQNALVGINARTSYLNRDGKKESIDATFTRYSVVFRGQELPDGTKAETVYLILNDPYLQVINNSVVRPLDYDYLAGLPPAAQRFYELVSFKMFAALKNGYPRAKLSYSEFCTAAPQTRYYDYDHFKKQMYKIQRPHLASGYLAVVSYTAATDMEGKRDWLMLYKPGPRAQSEFRAFSGGWPQTKLPPARSSKSSVPVEEALPPDSKQGSGAPAINPASPSHASDERRLTVQRFHKLARGVTDYAPANRGREMRQAEDLLAKYGSRRVNFLLDFAVNSAKRTKFRMRMFGALLQYVPEAMAEYDRIEKEEQARRHSREELEERVRQHDANLRKAEEALKSLSSDQYRALYERVKEDLIAHYPAIVAWKGPRVLQTMIKIKMAQRLDATEDEVA